MCRASSSWQALVKLVLDLLFCDKHRRAARIITGSTPRERRRCGQTPITPAAINEGERLYNQRADIYRDVNARSALDAARIIIRFYYRLTIGRDAAALDRKAPWQTARTRASDGIGLSRSSFRGGKRGSK